MRNLGVGLSGKDGTYGTNFDRPPKFQRKDVSRLFSEDADLIMGLTR